MLHSKIVSLRPNIWCYALRSSLLLSIRQTPHQPCEEITTWNILLCLKPTKRQKQGAVVNWRRPVQCSLQPQEHSETKLADREEKRGGRGYRDKIADPRTVFNTRQQFFHCFTVNFACHGPWITNKMFEVWKHSQGLQKRSNKSKNKRFQTRQQSSAPAGDVTLTSFERPTGLENRLETADYDDLNIVNISVGYATICNVRRST